MKWENWVWYFALSHWREIGIITVGFGLGNPKTRGSTWRGIKWSGRNVARPIAGGYGRAGANIGRAAGGLAARAIWPIASGYAIGATTGTTISWLAFGDEGAVQAADLYAPGGADLVNDGILDIPSNTWKIAKHYLT